MKACGLNWAGVKVMAGPGASKGCQVQRAGLVRWRINTSTGPNAVRAEAAVNAAGSVTRESLRRAAYLAGQSVSMPAAVLSTPM